MDNALSPSPLIAFPPEIWASVVRHLPGEQLGRLKMTGATSLWRKLCQAWVVRSVEFGHDWLRFWSWPSFVTEFPSLVKLTITCKWIEMRLKLNDIPATVRELSLDGPVRQQKPYDFFTGKDGKQLSLIEYLPHLERLHLASVKMQDYTWMLKTPPSLTDLEIAYWDEQIPLPPSLIHFSALEADITSLPSGFSMPPQLESLQINDGDNLDFRLVLPYLSSHFRRLSCHLTQLEDSFPIEKLPRSTTCLDYYPWFDFVESPESISLLPPNLTRLRTSSSLHPSLWSKLPPRLKILRLHPSAAVETTIISPITGQSHQVQALPLYSLPKSITDLTIHYKASNPDETAQGFCTPLPTAVGDYFPPHLTTFEVYTTDISVAAANCLPASLALYGCKNIGDSFFRNQQLPNLTDLDLRDANKITDAAIPFLSPCLQTLNLGASNAISGRCFRSLPQSLIYLDLRSSSAIFDLDIPHLPRGLMRAKLNAATRLTNRCVKHLPPRLASLSLKENQNITPDSSRHFPYPMRNSNYYGECVLAKWNMRSNNITIVAEKAVK